MSSPHAPKALRTARRTTGGSALPAAGIIRISAKDVFKTSEVKTSASFSFGLPQLRANLALCRPGGSGGVAAPVPIPNTAVKRPSADGTSS